MISAQAKRFWELMKSGPKQIDMPLAQRRVAGEHAEDATSEPAGVSFKPALDVDGFWAQPPDARPRAAILYLFGGGYVLGSPGSRRKTAGHLALAARARVLVPNYRLAPEHPFPAAVEDAVRAYQWLLANGAEASQSVIIGDSAGGGLAVASVVTVRERKLALPTGTVALSPWGDLTCSGDSMASRAASDIECTRAGLLQMAGWYMGSADPRQPHASPVFADLSGLPPLLCMVGGDEVLLDDSGGLLHVGPHSAGSQPGPACYGFGGVQPTVTDAAFLMGLLRAAKFFGGEMQLSHAAAENAFRQLAASLGTSLEDVAEKVYTIANHKMANAVRVVSVREGHDPRDYALIAFGGAGPLHAVAVAEELGISRVIIPMHPGAFSAYGLLCADLRRDFVRSVVVPLSKLVDADLVQLVTGLVADSMASARELGAGRLRWLFQAEARYRGQAHEVAVSLPARGPTVLRLTARFHQLHQRQFGFSNPHAEVELVNIRAIAVAERHKPRFPDLPARRSAKARGAGGKVFAGGRWHGAHYVAREELALGDQGEGPLVIEETTATSYVPHGWRYTIHAAGHLELVRG